jgi:hypothetical protein
MVGQVDRAGVYWPISVIKFAKRMNRLWGCRENTIVVRFEVFWNFSKYVRSVSIFLII